MNVLSRLGLGLVMIIMNVAHYTIITVFAIYLLLGFLFLFVQSGFLIYILGKQEMLIGCMSKEGKVPWRYIRIAAVIHFCLHLVWWTFL